MNTDSLSTLREAADRGDPKAQGELGWRYYTGDGVPKDYGQAVMWYRKAADKGESSAQNRLGVCYEKGHGVEVRPTGIDGPRSKVIGQPEITSECAMQMPLDFNRTTKRPRSGSASLRSKATIGPSIVSGTLVRKVMECPRTKPKRRSGIA